MRALIVDDDELSLELLREILREMGYQVDCASNGKQALEKLRAGDIHLVITDWEMPEMNGLELCQAIRSEDFDGYVFVIMLTSREGGQQRIDGIHAGADAFLLKPLNSEELLVSLKTAERILGLETRDLAMFALAKLSESRDPETGAHIERVQSFARLLAQYLSTTERYSDVIDNNFVRLIFQTAPLHDIGKVAIPDAVLLKPAKLTAGETAIMKTHAAIGAQTLDASLQRFPNVQFLQMARDIAMSHHERWDGTGYPDRLTGREIPLAARIVALADVYDALTSRRVYREALSHAQAKLLIVSERGTQFDPDIVDAFLKTETNFISIKEGFGETQRRITLTGPVELKSPGDATAPGATPGPAIETVLVADDDPGVRALLSNFLNARGIDCIIASDGAEAIALFDQHHPRLVISDWAMPKVDGLELCRRIRARSGGRHVHFIMLTGLSDEDQLGKAFDVGVDDFLAKPFNSTAMLTRLRAGLRAVALYGEISERHQGSQQLNEQLNNLNQRLERLAITDDLTGLYNRRQAMHRLEEHWALCDRYQRSVAVVSIDIDKFKSINDTHGHSAGDIVLQGVAEAMRRSVRTTDTVSRIGGEEFLIILPCQTTTEAEICAQRCRTAVEAMEFNYHGIVIRATISAGVAGRRTEMTQPAELLRDADRALYAAKHGGRNQVCVARPEAGEADVGAATVAA